MFAESCEYTLENIMAFQWVLWVVCELNLNKGKRKLQASLSIHKKAEKQKKETKKNPHEEIIVHGD